MVEQIAKRTAPHVDGVMRKTPLGGGRAIKGIPPGLRFADPERHYSTFRTDANVDQFELPVANLRGEPIAGLVHQGWVRFHRDDSIPFVQV